MAEDTGYTIAQAYIQIMPSTSKFGSSIKGEMETEGQKAGGHFGSGFKTGLKVIGAATAAAAGVVSKVVIDSVREFSEYEQLVGGVQKLFGDMDFQEVIDNAGDAFRTAGMSANEYMETVTSFSASLISSLGGDTQAAVDYADMAIRDMSDNANVFGTDMESIQNAYQGFAKQNYTMLDNLKLGYGGTKEEMERLISDANAVKTANGEMADLSIESFADVVEAIHIMQEQMSISGTTANEASTTIQGSVSSMKAAWDNLLVGLSDDSQDFGGLVNNLVETIVGVEDESGERVGGVINNIMPRVTQALEGLGTLVKEMIPELVAYIPEILGAVLPGLLESAGALVESFLGALPDIITVVAEALPGLLESLGGSIVTGLNNLTEQLPTLADSLSGVLLSILTYVSENASDIIDAFATFLSTLITEGIGILSENSAELATAFLEVVKAVIKAAIEHPELVAAIVGMKAIKSLGGLVMSTIGNGLSNAKTTLINKITSIFTSSDFSTGATTAGETLGKNMAASTGGGFASGLETAFTVIGGSAILVEGAKMLWGAYKGYLDEERKSSPFWLEEQENVDALVSSEASLAEQYDYLNTKLGGHLDLLIGYEGESNAALDLLNDWTGGLSDSQDGWYEVAKAMGYTGTATVGVAQNLKEMYEPLLESYLAEKEAAAATEEFAQEEEELATTTQTSASVIDEIYNQVFSESIPSALQGAVQSATDAGVQIPEGLVTGLDTGQIAEQSAIDRMNALVNFDSAIENAGLGGVSVSQGFVDAWLSGQYDWETANGYLNSLIDFTDAISAASESGTEITSELVNTLIADYNLEGVVNAADVIGANFADGLEGTVDDVGEASQVIYSEVVDTIDDLPDEMSGYGTDAGSKLDSGFGSNSGSISTTIDDIWDLYYNVLGVILPGNMWSWGYTAGTKFKNGLDDQKDNIQAKAAEFINSITDGLSGLNLKMEQKGYSAGINFKFGLNNAISGLSDSMYWTGYNAGIGFNNGLVASENTIYNNARTIANNVANTIRAALSIHSPSRVMTELGEDTGEGYAIGLDRSSLDVLEATQDMVQGVIDTSGSAELMRAVSQSGYDYGQAMGETDALAAEDADITGTLSQIVVLLEQLGHMQMVTDTGVLAGELAPAINQELGTINMREARG